jgi:hypothetical protein
MSELELFQLGFALSGFLNFILLLYIAKNLKEK